MKLTLEQLKSIIREQIESSDEEVPDPAQEQERHIPKRKRDNVFTRRDLVGDEEHEAYAANRAAAARARTARSVKKEVKASRRPPGSATARATSHISKMTDLLQVILDELGEFEGGANDRDIAEIEKHVVVIVKILAKIAARSGVPNDMIPQTYRL